MPNNSGVNLDLLIELICSHSHLYDLKNKNYKDNAMKENTWEEISIVLDMSTDDCKRLWKNLRDRFTKEKRRIKSGGAQPESEWPYFKKMLFYDKYCTSRKTISSTLSANNKCSTIIEKEPTSINNNNDQWNSLKTILPTDTTEFETIEAEDSEDIIIDASEPSVTDELLLDEVWMSTPSTSRNIIDTVNDEPISINSQHTPIQKNKKRPILDSSRPSKKNKKNEVNEIVNIAKQIGATIAKPSNVNDTFGMYVAACLNEMAPEEAKNCRARIFATLNES